MPRTSLTNPDFLRTIACVNESVKEVKCRTLCANADFWECIKTKKIGLFLKWIYESDWLVHYSSINYLYFTIVDIIDSIDLGIENKDHIDCLKNELYRLFKENYNSMLNILSSFNFPNIEEADIPRFFDGLIAIALKSSTPNTCTYQLINELIAAKGQNHLIFLERNPEKTIIKNFVSFYIYRISIFSASMHVLDEELNVQNQLKQVARFEKAISQINYEFRKSESDLYIQVADCWVGLMGKFSRYVNTHTALDVAAMWKCLSDEQRENFSTYAKIFKRSEDFSPILLHSIIAAA